MKKKFQISFSILLFLAVAAWAALYIATHDIDVLEPKGWIGLQQKDLIITAASLMLIVVIPVFILTFAFAWRYREGNGRAAYKPDWDRNNLAEFLWWGVPFIIIVFLAIITWRSSYALNPFKPIDTEKPAMEIQAVALDWKWLFLYPEQGIATVNYVQFPEKTPIHFVITADAPMNSFWIPQLGGQIYAMPAMRSQIHLIADEEGTFRGMSSNISGAGFAGMTFTVHASSREAFDDWVAQVKSSPKHLDFTEYRQLVEPSSYHPITLYRLMEDNLFEKIVRQYSAP